MHWKEILEVIATIMSIIVSTIIIFGAIAGHKSGFFKTIHHITKYRYDEIKKAKKK